MKSTLSSPTEISSLCGKEEAERGLSSMALGLVGSEILKIAAEIRALAAAGQDVCNLTVGDFNAAQFPIPKYLRDETTSALARGETNYPPSDGMPELRKAIQKEYEHRLGLKYPVDSVLIASGARPIIYSTYRAVLDPGETVLFPTPSWNNNHYVHLCGAHGVEVPVGAETNFLPTAGLLAPHLREARLVVVNTPLNPTGTVMAEAEVRALGEMLVSENARRKREGGRPLYLMYDHVYRTLTFRGYHHHTPVRLVPECAPYVIFVDAISKAFCATGLRVGWVVGPAPVVSRMRDIIGHVGAWAPRAEQVASAKLLDNFEEVDRFHESMLEQVSVRLEALYRGLDRLRAAGVPIEVIEPQGAIYLTARFNFIGKKAPKDARFPNTPDTFQTNEQIRRFLLERAGFGVVPFQAFGVKGENGWFRLSVGAVSVADIERVMTRLEAAVSSIR
ncbi:MAG: aminotransferase class I/II-fold pyridoxal phosphate-dependent enzyme [Planctomycetes bacterium]|nr:aminotransferase class I/II-fold pyridoxal phosphate-dependent enzyme [Planctomycetota bacterium]